ncbi:MULTISPECIES: hypothetical protein [unclassified Mesorhizobium]|uniref:hypothetical protein n=1 Tax=unclassified Mesorhizobium TaxID=325217 RepID=UPI001127F1BC|nr:MULTISPECIES: hypothetical protein [unclassified Mesorhizobium]TPJ39873.1 hypothetical protein FJ437_27160 [Mesorhizobium sp. B2-6-6]MCA0003353.1 hypothetical protein [Mesorhizobium sp. B264B2A]MCA0009992.1 hypothetical protein [Mesorhizobium sp. B264B1B]MCA0019604.1 hypothetical protein [Mesorhizobium sp. B264B1A]TPN61732.1 hypothetical protein FJ986_27815 [Mesorhizobium sp. B1-1-1]
MANERLSASLWRAEAATHAAFQTIKDFIYPEYENPVKDALVTAFLNESAQITRYVSPISPVRNPDAFYEVIGWERGMLILKNHNGGRLFVLPKHYEPHPGPARPPRRQWWQFWRKRMLSMNDFPSLLPRTPRPELEYEHRACSVCGSLTDEEAATRCKLGPDRRCKGGAEAMSYPDGRLRFLTADSATRLNEYYASLAKWEDWS